MNLDLPFFILGNPRSGTTLFRLMLHHHSNLVVPPECGFVEWWYNKYHDWKVADIDSNRLADFVKDLSVSKKIETWGLNYDHLIKLIIEAKPATYAKLCGLVYFTYASQKEKKTVERWGDKNNYYIQHLCKLNEIYPNAQYILIVRDGRDVACSYREVNQLKTSSPYKPNLPSSITKIGLEWAENHERIFSFFQNLPEDRNIIIRYEDLLQHSQQEMERITSFLKVNFDKRMLNYFEKTNVTDPEPTLLLDWKKKTLQPPDSEKIGRYKLELTKKEISEFDRVAGKWLRFFKYE